MNTYYMLFKVSPTTKNKHYETVKGALAHCWVLDSNPVNAYLKARFHVSRYDWKIEDIKTHPVNVTENDFRDKDLDIEAYRKAQEDGIASFFVAWSRDGKTTIPEPVRLETSYDIDLNRWLSNLKSLSNTGRCLHYESGERCKDIVKAHSIQKQGILSTIAHGGHVYRLAADITILNMDFHSDNLGNSC